MVWRMRVSTSGSSSMVVRAQEIVDLGSDDRNILGSVNADANPLALDADKGNCNPATDVDFFPRFSAQHQHGG